MAANGHVYNPHTADAWKEQIKFTFRPCQKATITGAVSLRVTFFLPKPKSMKDTGVSNIPHTKKPDTDNLLKSTMDALTEIKVWADDSQVNAIDASKWYGRKVGAQIIIES
jgi:Holliday junction resolvase RusA-like endonuclease